MRLTRDCITLTAVAHGHTWRTRGAHVVDTVRTVLIRLSLQYDASVQGMKDPAIAGGSRNHCMHANHSHEHNALPSNNFAYLSSLSPYQWVSPQILLRLSLLRIRPAPYPLQPFFQHPPILVMSTAPHNFCRVSARDAEAFGSSRPGFPNKAVTSDEVSAWLTFMRSQGIKRVLSLLGDDEKVDYFPDMDIDAVMTDAFGQGCYVRTSVFVDGARDVMTKALAEAKDKNQPIVVHCSGGEGRAALGMALWLVDRYGLAPEDAAREIEEETARNEGIARKVNASKLAHLVTNGSMLGFKK